MAFPKIRCTFLRVPRIRIIACWGSPHLRKLPNCWASIWGGAFTKDYKYVTFRVRVQGLGGLHMGLCLDNFFMETGHMEGGHNDGLFWGNLKIRGCKP